MDPGILTLGIAAIAILCDAIVMHRQTRLILYQMNVDTVIKETKDPKELLRPTEEPPYLHELLRASAETELAILPQRIATQYGESRDSGEPGQYIQNTK